MTKTSFAWGPCFRASVVLLSRSCRVPVALLSCYYRASVVILSRSCRVTTVTFLSCYYRASVVLLSRYCRVELKLQWGKPEWYLTKNIAEAYSPIDFGTTVAGSLFFYDVALYQRQLQGQFILKFRTLWATWGVSLYTPISLRAAWWVVSSSSDFNTSPSKTAEPGSRVSNMQDSLILWRKAAVKELAFQTQAAPVWCDS